MRPFKIKIAISLLLGIICFLSYGQKISFQGSVAKMSIANNSHFELASMASDATGEIQFSDSTFYLALHDSTIYEFNYTPTSYGD